MYLIGSKMDKLGSRAVKAEEGQELAAKHGCQFCEVSSKTRENVRKPFVEIVDTIVKDPTLLSAGSRRSGAISVTGVSDEGGVCGC